jgi:hypothetical protein
MTTIEPEYNQKRLTISISQVAPLIGLDNYGNFPRIVCEIWRRYNPVEFREYEQRLKSAGYQLSNASEFNDIWETDELLGTNILDQVKAINANTTKTSADMTKAQQNIKEYINQQKKLTTEQKEALITKVCSSTNKSHGISNEDTILEEFCRLTDMKIKDTQEWVEIPLVNSTDDMIKWVIVGKYDGITTTGELVEAKMRQKGLFKKMRDYENVQVQLYLHALGFKCGYLIEGFTSKKNGVSMLSVYTHDVSYDAGYVEEVILERLRGFTRYFQELMQESSRKENILKGSKTEFSRYQEIYLVGTDTLDF